jgi:hypothetical protein
MIFGITYKAGYKDGREKMRGEFRRIVDRRKEITLELANHSHGPQRERRLLEEKERLDRRYHRLLYGKGE